MLFDGVTASFLVALLRGGRIRHLGELHIRWVPVMLAVFLAQYGALYLSLRGARWVTEIGDVLFPLTLAVLLAAVWQNRQRWEFWVIGLGILCNLLVIVANGGHMPVSPTGLEAAGLGHTKETLASGIYFTHELMDEETRLPFLADIFYFAPPYPRPRVFSIGDVFMIVGVFLLIQRVMVRRQPAPRAAPVPPPA